MWRVVATCLGCRSEVRVGSAAVLVPGAELRSIGAFAPGAIPVGCNPLCVLGVEVGSHVAQAGLELLGPLPLLTKNWGCRPSQPHPFTQPGSRSEPRLVSAS